MTYFEFMFGDCIYESSKRSHRFSDFKKNKSDYQQIKNSKIVDFTFLDWTHLFYTHK
jgi:hypothetical protein